MTTFNTFLDKRYFVPIPDNLRPDKNANFCDHAFYHENFGVRFIFNHYDVTIDENYHYYVRCVDRFRAALKSSDGCILV